MDFVFDTTSTVNISRKEIAISLVKAIKSPESPGRVATKWMGESARGIPISRRASKIPPSKPMNWK